MNLVRYRALDGDRQWFGVPIGRAALPELTAAAVDQVGERIRGFYADGNRA